MSVQTFIGFLDGLINATVAIYLSKVLRLWLYPESF